MSNQKIEPCNNPEACNAQGCVNPLGRCEEAAEAGRDPDDSVLVCASDLQHSAIFDNHEEVRDCMNAIAKRLKDIAAAPQVVADDGLVPLSVDGKSVWLEGIGAVALDYSSVKSLSDIQEAAAPVQAQEPMKVFSSGEWVYGETGQKFSSDELNEVAFTAYRAPVQPVAVPDGEFLSRVLKDRIKMWESYIANVMRMKASGFPIGGTDEDDCMLKVERAKNLLTHIAAPAAQGDAEPEALLYAALNTQGRIVYSHESYENVDMNRRYIKTPTTIVGLAPIAAKAAS